MRNGFFYSSIHALLIFSFICPPWAFAAAPKPSDKNFCAEPVKDLASPFDADSAKRVLSAAGQISGPVTAESQAMVERATSVAELAAQIAKAQNEIRALLQSERAEKTHARVQRASGEVKNVLDQVSRDLAWAQAHLDQINGCPTSGTIGWLGKQVACAYFFSDKALAHISKYVLPVVIGYTSELVGLDAAGLKAMREARESILAEINSTREDVLKAMSEGKNSEFSKLNLHLTWLELRKWVWPYLVGSASQIAGIFTSSYKWLTGPKATEEQSARNSAGWGGFLGGFWKGIKDASTSWRLETLRSEPYFMGDYIFRFTLVALTNVIINTVAAIPYLGSLAQSYFTGGAAPKITGTTPWQLIPNAGTMMAIQSEVGAKNTHASIGNTPAKDQNELLQRIPAVIAGNQGFVYEGWNRLVGFVAAMPVELPILATWTYLAATMLNGDSVFSIDTVGSSFSQSAGFISLFGAYLVTKWAIFDKVMDLGFIPEFRALYKRPFEEKLIAIAKEKGFPTEMVDTVDPITKAVTRLETIPWLETSWRWQQWIKAHWPDKQTQESGITKKERLNTFLEGRKKFNEFMATPEVAALMKTSEGRAWARARLIERLYRAGNTAFDTFIAIMLAKKPISAPVDTVSVPGSYK
jgi:hypothetical protein